MENLILIEKREQYLKLCIKQVEESMSKLPMSADSLVVKLLMTAFDAGYDLAKHGQVLVEV